METVGERLRAARKNKNLSQNAVSEALLISRQSISKWENNVCLPDLDNLKKICDLYEITPNDLLAENVSEFESSSNTFVEKEAVENRLHYSSFFIPFYFFIVLLNKDYRDQINKKNVILFLLNITFSLYLLLSLYMELPKITTNYSI